MKKALAFAAAIAVILLIGAFATGLIDLDKTKDGELPSVSVDAGELPEFDVDTGSVEVGTTTEKVLVPKVVLEEETVEMPTVEIEPADDDGDE